MMICATYNRLQCHSHQPRLQRCDFPHFHLSPICTASSPCSRATVAWHRQVQPTLRYTRFIRGLGGLHGPQLLTADRTEHGKRTHCLACRTAGIATFVAQQCLEAQETVRHARLLVAACFVFFFWKSRRAAGLRPFESGVVVCVWDICSDRYVQFIQCQSYPELQPSVHIEPCSWDNQQATFQIPGGVTSILGVFLYVFIYPMVFVTPSNAKQAQ